MASKKPVPPSRFSDQAVELLITDLIDSNTEWYQRWYLQLRLHEEVLRGLRYERPLSILGLELPPPLPTNTAELHLLFRLLKLILDELRAVDIPGVLEDYSHFCILLPETDREGAEVVEWRLQKMCRRIGMLTQVAVLGEDGESTSALLEAARPTTVRRLRVVR